MVLVATSALNKVGGGNNSRCTADGGVGGSHNDSSCSCFSGNELMMVLFIWLSRGRQASRANQPMRTLAEKVLEKYFENLFMVSIILSIGRSGFKENLKIFPTVIYVLYTV